MRRFDVHVHLLARDDAAELELMPARDEREIVGEEQVAFTFEAGERGAAEIGPRIADPRELAGRVSDRGVVPGGSQQVGPAQTAGDIGENPRLVHTVAGAELIERLVREGRRPVPQYVPQRTAEGLTRLERLERSRGAGGVPPTFKSRRCVLVRSNRDCSGRHSRRP